MDEDAFAQIHAVVRDFVRERVIPREQKSSRPMIYASLQPTSGYSVTHYPKNLVGSVSRWLKTCDSRSSSAIPPRRFDHCSARTMASLAR
jgi:hypothetical protein